jgi:serine/threonine protein kinase
MTKFCPKCGRQFAAIDPAVNCPDDDHELVGSSTSEVGPGVILGGKYLLVSEIGSGGWGTVYLARHHQLGVDFAVKVLSRELAASLSKIAGFEREALFLAGLSHDNIVKVLDYGIKPRPYIVTEYVKGTVFSELVAQSLDDQKLLAIACGLFDVLAFAHAAGVIHRDIKPQNIMIQNYDTSPRIKLLDFGMARLVGSQTDSPNRIAGSLAYTSPEQFKGEVGTAGDIYAAGCLLFECCSGRHPFRPRNDYEQWRLMHETEMPALKAEDTRLSPAKKEMLRLAMSCLAKEPSDRPTASDMKDRLQALVEPLAKKAHVGRAGKVTIFAAAIGVLLAIGCAPFFMPAPSRLPRDLKTASRKALIATLQDQKPVPVTTVKRVSGSEEIAITNEAEVFKPEGFANSNVIVVVNQKTLKMLAGLNALLVRLAASGSTVTLVQLINDCRATGNQLVEIVSREQAKSVGKYMLITIEQPLSEVLRTTSRLKESQVAAVMVIDASESSKLSRDELHKISLPMFYIVDSSIRGPQRDRLVEHYEDAFTYGTGKQIVYSSTRVSLRSAKQPGLDEQVFEALLTGFRDAILNDDVAKERYLFSQQSVQAVGASASLKMR